MEIGNQFWEYEDNCRLNDSVDLDVLYRDLDEFTAGVAEVVEQFQPHNCYTTCMWHNLITCKVLYDRDGRLARAKERFSVPYPPQLRENILERGWKLFQDLYRGPGPVAADIAAILLELEKLCPERFRL